MNLIFNNLQSWYAIKETQPNKTLNPIGWGPMNTPTAARQKGKTTLPTSVLDMMLNNLMTRL